MIDLIQLHQNGAEVSGPHGDAWLRLPAVRNHRVGVLTEIRELHARLGRLVLPTDLTGTPPPHCVTGAAVKDFGRATPGRASHHDRRALTTAEISALDQAIKAVGNKHAASIRWGLSEMTLSGALKGTKLMGKSIEKLTTALAQAPAPAEQPKQPAAAQATEPAAADPHPTDEPAHETATERRAVSAATSRDLDDETLRRLLDFSIECLDRGDRTGATVILKAITTYLEAA